MVTEKWPSSCVNYYFRILQWPKKKTKVAHSCWLCIVLCAISKEASRYKSIISKTLQRRTVPRNIGIGVKQYSGQSWKYRARENHVRQRYSTMDHFKTSSETYNHSQNNKSKNRITMFERNRCRQWCCPSVWLLITKRTRSLTYIC